MTTDGRNESSSASQFLGFVPLQGELVGGKYDVEPQYESFHTGMRRGRLT
jgi:hypothetical protein